MLSGFHCYSCYSKQSTSTSRVQPYASPCPLIASRRKRSQNKNKHMHALAQSIRFANCNQTKTAVTPAGVRSAWLTCNTAEQIYGTAHENALATNLRTNLVITNLKNKHLHAMSEGRLLNQMQSRVQHASNSVSCVPVVSHLPSFKSRCTQ